MRTIDHRRCVTTLAGAALALASACACAEGGPPMLTDDPGTPGDGHWEINTSLQSEHAGDATTFKLPLLDFNYGIGERLQLKFEVPWELQRIKGQRDVSGAGNSIAGVKWRFFDAGDAGWQISTYPQVQSRFPVSGSALADGGVSYLMPLQFERKFGDWGVNFDIGRWFRPADQGDTWIGGIAIGRDVAEGLEIMGELHDERDAHSSRNELALNFGTRWELSKRFTLLVSAGTDLHNDLDQKASLISYVGLQTNL
ncbi:MAG TPA: hypothetical protein VFL07_00635 [Rudaea sp.]|nr:hypothetical protein [Rudaea sp.]HSC13192.1 hypothetical protein [Rhodanobacteraceae bacterium]